MSFSSLHKRVTYLIAGLGLGALFLGGELSPLAQVVITAVFVASMWCEPPRIESAAWQRGTTAVVIALFVIELVRGLAGEPLLPLILEFTAALQLTRLCNRRTAVEHQQIAFLAFLHLCAATVLSTEIAYGAAFIGFVIVTPWMLALTHLRREIEGHYPSDRISMRAADVRRVLASRRVVGPWFLAGTAALSLPLFLTTGIIFLAFPRVGLGILSFGTTRGAHVAGFGDGVTLGEVGLLEANGTIVMRAVPSDLPAAPPLRAALRMRGTSFDHYDGVRWTRTRRDIVGVPTDRVYPLFRLPDPGRDATVDIVLGHLDPPVVFLPDRTVALEIPPRIRSGIPVDRQLTLSAGLDLRYEDGDGLGLRYRAHLSRDPREGLGRISPDELRAYLQVPEGHARVAALAREWTASAQTNRERADRIAERLRSFRYSRQMRDPGDRAPLEAFLFEWRAGHCEYFSTAMVVMLRAVGVPARNTTGFLGGRWNSFGRYYAITQGDAHSWVEVWLDDDGGAGWVTYDPTPSLAVETSLFSEVVETARAFLDALRTRWDNDIVGYDLRSQQALARGLGGWFRARRLGSSELRWEVPRGYWIAGLTLVALAIALYLGRARVGTSRPTQAMLSAGARDVVSIYQGLEQALAAGGLGRPPERTPLEHASWIAERDLPFAESVKEITERYMEIRWGGGRVEPEELARMRENVRAIGRALKR